MKSNLLFLFFFFPDFGKTVYVLRHGRFPVGSVLRHEAVAVVLQGTKVVRGSRLGAPRRVLGLFRGAVELQCGGGVARNGLLVPGVQFEAIAVLRVVSVRIKCEIPLDFVSA